MGNLGVSARVSPLQRIYNPKGDILHAITASSADFAGFGEAYFTLINFGEVKGWKKHLKMFSNLVVPVGRVRFHVFNELTSQLQVFEIGPSNYSRLTVPPGLWLSFKGLDKGVNLILNIASIEHDPIEAVSAPLSAFPMEPRI